MKQLSFFVCLAAAGSVFAQCPADPTTVLAGKWAFQFTSGNRVLGNVTFNVGSYRFQTAFTAQSGEFVYQGGVGAGSYAFSDANCTQGTIYFNNNFGPDGGGIQANFFVTANGNYGRVLTLRSTNPPATFPVPYVDPTDTSKYAQIGTAWPAPTACPAGVTPALNLLSGTYNTFTLSGITGTPSNTTPALVGRLVVGSANLAYSPSYLDPRGLFTAFLIPTYPNPQQAVVPPPAALPNVSNNGDPGQYQVAPDCSGGQMWVYFAWPRTYNIYFYSRLRLSGAIDFVGLGNTTIGAFATTDVAIAR